MIDRWQILVKCLIFCRLHFCHVLVLLILIRIDIFIAIAVTDSISGLVMVIVVIVVVVEVGYSWARTIDQILSRSLSRGSQFYRVYTKNRQGGSEGVRGYVRGSSSIYPRCGHKIVQRVYYD